MLYMPEMDPFIPYPAPERNPACTLDALVSVCVLPCALVALTRRAAQHGPIPSLRSHWATEASAACSPSGSPSRRSPRAETGQASLRYGWGARARTLQHRCCCCRCRYARPCARPGKSKQRQLATGRGDTNPSGR